MGYDTSPGTNSCVSCPVYSVVHTPCPLPRNNIVHTPKKCPTFMNNSVHTPKKCPGPPREASPWARAPRAPLYLSITTSWLLNAACCNKRRLIRRRPAVQLRSPLIVQAIIARLCKGQAKLTAAAENFAPRCARWKKRVHTLKKCPASWKKCVHTLKSVLGRHLVPGLVESWLTRALARA